MYSTCAFSRTRFLENRETKSRRDERHGEKLDGVKRLNLVASGRQIFVRLDRLPRMLSLNRSQTIRIGARLDAIRSYHARWSESSLRNGQTREGKKRIKTGKRKNGKKRRNGLEREVASLFAETRTRSRNRVRAKAAELWSRLHGSYSWPRWPLSRISDSTVGAESRLEGGDAAARRSPSRSASPSPFVCVSRRFCCSLHTVTHTGPFVGEGS